MAAKMRLSWRGPQRFFGESKGAWNASDMVHLKLQLPMRPCFSQYARILGCLSCRNALTWPRPSSN